ncbi:hypothetical protein ABI59_17040 [Acidobacteria bacterium Mor1]|nr:hypothetical protein ABI59_17040 [Acidobacteria bacterium Mor1]
MTGLVDAGTLSPLVDDFSDPARNSLEIQRMFLDDTSAGGKTRVEHRVQAGVLSVSGEIEPPRGQPGWSSTVLLLDPKGQPRDASAYQGIRLRIRISQGNVSISANSSKVANFDYHAATVTVPGDGKFHEVKIPFSSMQRMWSEKTSLDARTIASISLVAFGVRKGPFDFEVDELSFY